MPPSLTSTAISDVRSIVERFALQPVRVLSEYIRDSYPSFSASSISGRPAVGIGANRKVFTAGYEGLQIDGFLHMLLHSGVQRLVDVRSNPVARRFGFHKSTLGRLCGLLGIDYVHVPQLGIASEERRQLNTEADYDSLFARYEQTTLINEETTISLVCSLVKEKPSVLVCFEADACMCHRSRLAERIALATNLLIVHLESSHQ
ncbi:MAG: DUF488 domain-containing protein [Planctomycetota bacterium]